MCKLVLEGVSQQRELSAARQIRPSSENMHRIAAVMRLHFAVASQHV